MTTPLPPFCLELSLQGPGGHPHRVSLLRSHNPDGFGGSDPQGESLEQGARLDSAARAEPQDGRRRQIGMGGWQIEFCPGVSGTVGRLILRSQGPADIRSA